MKSATRRFVRGDFFKSTDSQLEFVLLNYDGEYAVVASWNERSGARFFVWPASSISTEDGVRHVSDIKHSAELADVINAMDPAT